SSTAGRPSNRPTAPLAATSNAPSNPLASASNCNARCSSVPRPTRLSSKPTIGRYLASVFGSPKVPHRRLPTPPQTLPPPPSSEVRWASHQLIPERSGNPPVPLPSEQGYNPRDLTCSGLESDVPCQAPA